MKKIAIVYIAHDGFTSLYTGVGTVARDFLLSFPYVCKKFKEEHEGIDLTLFATTLKYNKDCFGYSEEVKKVTQSYTRKYNNIHLIELLNGSAGKKSYGSIDLWRNACISSATFIYSLINFHHFDKIIAICIDTPFTQVANYFFEQYSYRNVDFIWLPQSTALVHKYDSALEKSLGQDNYIDGRYIWEKAVIDLAKENLQVKIGYVGKFMKQHLLKDYDARQDTLVSLQNGLFFNRLKSYIVDQRRIASSLKSLGVPLKRPLLFSFARAEPYKGLDLVIKNSTDLIKKMNYYILIFASPYSMDDPYVSEMNKLAEKYPQDIKIIYCLDFLTPHHIMQWHNTKVLALLSRAEPFGLIPIESRFYRNNNLSLIVSDLGGYLEQVTEGIDGFKTELDDRSIVSKFEEIATLSPKRKTIMAKKGYDRIIRAYDQIKINSDLIEKYIKD